MAYEIISIGDGEMLYNAFQGVAMIFGNNSLNKLISAGFALGILLISLRYLTDQEFPLRYALVGLILYLVMFTPKDTVTIEDIYSGQVRVVANVPIGVAIPMSVISTMGVKMTEMFETAFSTPAEANMLQHGYLDSLNTLIKLRNIGTGTAGSNNGLSGDLSKTINAYIENCVMFDLEIATGNHEVSRESLQKSPDLWDAMRTTFINRDIMVYLPNAPAGEQKSCENAYKSVNEYMAGGDFKAQWAKYMQGVLDIHDPAVSPEDRIDVAAQALSLAGIDAQTYMRNALMASYLKDGPAAFIKRTGQEQLNLQWAGEQSMFNQIERPLMAFVEMFTVATSPIVAFLSTLGPAGMTMIVRYIQMMIWIALWGPVMAVCNLYITIVTSRAMDAMATQAADNGSALSSMVMHDKLYQTLEIWLSAGGMLASSVPALSLMLVYGGSVAATNLSGKMTSGASNSVNPGRLAPDPVSIESSMKLGSMAEYSPNTGAKKSGMADTQFSASSTFGRASQSATDSLHSASATASQALNSMTQSTNRSGSMSSDSNSVMSSLTNSTSESDNWAASTGRTIGDRVGTTQSEKEAVSAAVSGSLAAGLSAGNISPATLGASAQAQLQSTTGMDAAKSKEISDQVQDTWSKGYAGSSQVAKMQQSAQQHSDQTFFGSEDMKAKGEQYLSQLQAVDQASEKFTQTASMQDSAGKSLSLPYQDLATRLNKSGALPDINKANEELQSKMSDKDKANLSENAQYEINRSSASGLVGGDRDALAGFLKLNQQDPAKAAEILNSAIMPTSSGSGVNISPTEFKKDSQSVDGIVSNETAAGFRSKAKGEDGDHDISSDIDSQRGHGAAANKSASQTSHQDHAPKPSADNGNKNKLVAPSAGIKDSKSGGSTSAGSPKAKVDAALKNANLGNAGEFRSKIESGGKLGSKDTSGMMGGAMKNEGHLAYDNVAKPAISAATTAADFATSTARSALIASDKAFKPIDDAIKNTFGGGDKQPKQPSNPSDNDLPPTQKK